MPCRNCAYISAHYKKEIAKLNEEIRQLRDELRVCKASHNLLQMNLAGEYD